MARALMTIVTLLLLFPAAARAQEDADPDFLHHVTAETSDLLILRSGLAGAVAFGRARPDLFSPDKGRRDDLIPREAKMALWTTWSEVLAGLAGLDSIRRAEGGFDLFEDAGRRNASFALGHAAFLAGYRHALEFIALTEGNPSLDTILNEDVPELGIPAGTFAKFKFRFLNVGIAGEFAAREAVARTYRGGSSVLREAMEDDARVIWRMGRGKGQELTFKNALAMVRKTGFVAWFPVQKGVAEVMGDTRVARPGTHLISANQIDSIGRRLLPGDLIVERHEWYLSNLGLPGFWTHVALFVGTADERRAFFDDPEVRSWVRAQGADDGDLETLLRQREPAAWARSSAPAGDGRPVRILEAISEGVSFTSLEYTAASDSIGVMRPNLTRTEKAEAIVRAFHFAGRPYDFNFDFQTDAALVCSELIFKAYEPGDGMRGLRLPIIEVMGRKVSTPNEIVRQFDVEAGAAGAQSAFVLFLDGYEKERRAVESTGEEFRASWRRPNWHILVQDPPVGAD